MDGIAPIRGRPPAPGSPPVVHRPTASLPFSGAPWPAGQGVQKTAADYLRALRRRIWLVLTVAVPMSIVASTLALRQPRIYQARAEITIDPPQYNPALSTLVSQEIGRHDPLTQEKYVPNRVAFLQSKGLAELVVSRPALAAEVARFDDPAQELILKGLQARPVGKTNLYIVTLEGTDPARTKKLLEALLSEFKLRCEEDNRRQIDDTKEYADQRLKKLKSELQRLDEKIYGELKTMRMIGPGGKNIFEEQYVTLGLDLAHKKNRVAELTQQLMVAQMFPRIDHSGEGAARQQRIEQLELQKKKLVLGLMRIKRTARNFNNDPSAREIARMLDETMHELKELSSMKTKMAGSPTEMILEHHRREVEDTTAQLEEALARMQESMPDHQRFLSLLEDRNQLRQRIAVAEHNLATFDILAESEREPVRIPPSVVEPTIPVRPNRAMTIGLGLMLSLGMGIGLVVLLEHTDHSVRVVEHVSQGLGLPLLGVVPRVRRTALTHRGNHLWTGKTPDSLEADAYRNIRASLLGVEDRRGPIVTLLVTSPKAGDGKSTAALNLALTCARAGERTLLVDVDLRRPTLGEVFPPDPEKASTALGLIDVLKGTLPWQRTVRHTDVPNLDFLATGDPIGVPIEILGTLELRQLLTALSNHYDRVILDGPAVLGLADCRMLGRMVDAALMIVRAGVHQLVTLQRAKAMLEQSHVAIAGVVVNNLHEDLENWSSYGYGSPAAALAGGSPRGLASSGISPPRQPRDPMVLAGSIES
jgi:succinoglycan biosynthesis transport protein ExoP